MFYTDFTITLIKTHFLINIVEYLKRTVFVVFGMKEIKTNRNDWFFAGDGGGNVLKNINVIFLTSPLYLLNLKQLLGFIYYITITNKNDT